MKAFTYQRVRFDCRAAAAASPPGERKSLLAAPNLLDLMKFRLKRLRT